jgi:hypothetical protein
MLSSTLAQGAPAIPPGVPEPGLILWGSVVNATNNLPIQVTSASWSVTDGSNTAVYAQSTRPPVQIITLAGSSYYVLEVPFDTRRFGTVVLGDPATEGVNSFELKSSSPPAYTLTPTINGVLASVRSIDGAPASGATVPVSGFSAAVRGRVIRVDLAITPISETYEQWAARIFGSGHPNAAAGADPDGDGMSNAGEYTAGTDPRSSASALRLLGINLSPNQATLGWQSIADKQYILEVASDINGPWTDVSSTRASNSTTELNVSRNPSDARHFYRVRAVAP